MKAQKNDHPTAEKFCKKCGAPLTSTSKYKYCDNCRREKAKTRRQIGETVLALGVTVCSCIPVVKHFVKKK